MVLQMTLGGEWRSWQEQVPQIEIETHRVAAPDLVIPTLDTVRHEQLMRTWFVPPSSALIGPSIAQRSPPLPGWPSTSPWSCAALQALGRR